MIDFLGLCRRLVQAYPLPSKAAYIKQTIDDYLDGSSLTRVQQGDVVRVLIRNWDRNINKLRQEKASNLKNNIRHF